MVGLVWQVGFDMFGFVGLFWEVRFGKLWFGRLQAVASFDSCYKLLPVLTAVTSGQTAVASCPQL